MRKNRMMRAASALMVAVLLTTSTISGTFAKYVTTSEAKDEARVAKWGVELQTIGNLYGEAYENDVIVSEDDTTFEVKASNEIDADGVAGLDDVVAPGTKNDGVGFIFSLKGQPEVDGKITSEIKAQNIFLKEGKYGVLIPVDTTVVTEANFNEFEAGTFYYEKNTGEYAVATAYSANLYTLEDYVELTGNYYPVIYKLSKDVDNGVEYVDGTHTADSLNVIADKLADALAGADVTLAVEADFARYGYANNTGRDFDVNDKLDTLLNLNGQKLTWAWAFERELVSGTPEEKAAYTKMYNGADTILGMLLHAENANATFPGAFKFSTEGIVVKFDNNGTDDDDSDDFFKAPVEYTDYCLETMFNLAITVTQVD